VGEDVLEAAVGRLKLTNRREHPNEPIPRLWIVEGIFCDCRELGEALLEDRRNQVVLVGEPAVERSHPDSRAARDLVDAGIEPALAEHGLRCDEDRIAIPLSITPKQRCHVFNGSTNRSERSASC
jgi:hypothetical protein